MFNHSPKLSLPQVSKISVEYSDGSSDTIKLLQDGDLTIYALDRNRVGIQNRISGGYTNAEIAGILFISVMTTNYTDYSVADKRIYSLIEAWREILKKSYN